MRWILEYRIHRTGFDDLARIHDGDAVTKSRDDAEVVGNQNDGESHLLLQFRQ